MAVNWVMLGTIPNQPFINLPNEKTIYTSPPRTALSLHTPKQYPGTQPLSIQSSAGCIYLTNQRIIYIPATPTAALQSFSSPLLNLHDTHVSAPFFGPNVWTAALQPVPGGGIPSSHSFVELKLTFKEGGAFDFHSQFERIKERLRQAVDSARESGLMSGDGEDVGGGRGGGPLAALDLSAVHLDELPAYDGPSTASSRIPVFQQPPRPTGSSSSDAQHNSYQPPANPTPNSSDGTQDQTFQPPSEPPPGYEEAQQQSVSDELDMRLRRASQS